ncbi:MAG: DNA polymerase III subunit alpha [Gammaproteobacteria bacterium]|nr:DNA polymerase III subunit alpha [Gammaproteobacteria bacterium]
MKEFIHLNVHSEYSLSDGIVRIDELVSQCEKLGQPAAALTDLNNMYALVKFYRACIKAGVKPIIGCDVWVAHPDSPNQHRMILLCQNNEGYLNLSRLLTVVYLDRDRSSTPYIEWTELNERSEGLLCLLDDREGPLAALDEELDDRLCLNVLREYQKVFTDRLYMAVSRVGWQHEETYLALAVKHSLQSGIPIVATNRVVFLNQDEFEAHEIRTCINNKNILGDKKRPRNYTAEQYFRSSQEMEELFKDIPVALENTVAVAKRCNLFVEFGKDHLPKFPGAGDRPEEQLLREKSERGLSRLFHQPSIRNAEGGSLIDDVYIERLEMELEVITKMGFSGYFLIVADFIAWSRNNGIPVGPGRGSGAGSLVAWATGITRLDPIRHGLIFERFLNPDRISLPDFDIDFCVDGRDRVIEYVSETYGRDRVAQIITFGTMAAKAVVRDVGRVLGLPYGFVDPIARLIPFDLGMTLKKALSGESELERRYQEDPQVKSLIDRAMEIEGVARNVGKHAGGVVIAPAPLIEFTPLYSDAHLNQAITQFDKDDLETIGLVKFDFLGLRTLTIIERAVKLINQQRLKSDQEMLDIDSLSLDDEQTYRLIQSGRTTAIFQLESQGMKKLIVEARPTTFEDLTALIAMYRPGPLQSGMVKDYIDGKAGRKPVKYLDQRLEPTLKSTYGVILYQEQVMKTAQTLAGYTLGEADILRKAMGKKLPAEMAKQRETFVSGAISKGVEEKLATNIFDLMEKFAGYGFNKSHSAAYALVAYQTAWLKAHYPAAFMAATLTSEISNTDKVVAFLAECKVMGLKVNPPHINTSYYDFRPLDETTISYGLGSIKGIGRGLVEELADERDANGDYQDFYDVCERSDVKKLNKRTLESLAKSGALDGMGLSRSSLVENIPDMMNAAAKKQDDSALGQFDLFGMADEEFMRPEPEVLPEWPELERLTHEKGVLGFYLTGHPIDLHKSELMQVILEDFPGPDSGNRKKGMFAGIVTDTRSVESRKGRIGLVTLEDAERQIEIRLFPEKYRELIGKIEKDRVLIAIGEWNHNESIDRYQLNANMLMDMEELRNEGLVALELVWEEASLNDNAVKRLLELLEQHRDGHVSLQIRYTQRAGATGCVSLGENWKIHPSQCLLDNLKGRYGPDSIRYAYDRSKFSQYHRQSRNSHNGKMAYSS